MFIHCIRSLLRSIYLFTLSFYIDPSVVDYYNHYGGIFFYNTTISLPHVLRSITYGSSSSISGSSTIIPLQPTSLSSSSSSSSSRATELTELTVVGRAYYRGDIVDRFQLKERLESLGSTKLYVKEDYKITSTLDNKLYLTHPSYHRLYVIDDSSKGVAYKAAAVEHIDLLTGPTGMHTSNSDVDLNGHSSDHELVVKDDSIISGVLMVNQTKDNNTTRQYYLKDKLFLGGHGEIWRAKVAAVIPSTSTSSIANSSSSSSPDTDYSESHYILKRMYVKNKPHILRCALREIYFGTRLRSDKLVARFVTHFVLDDDYWLVFRDEGVSLQQLLYAVTKSTADDSSSSGSGGGEDRKSGRHGTSRSAPAQYSVLEPSAIWMKLRTAAEGGQSVKSIMFKIISGAYNLHSQGIVHRDLKPSNILLNVDDTVVTDDDDDDEALMVESDDGSFDTASEQGHQRRGRSNTYRPQRHDHSTDVAKLVIADFSSALSSEVLHDLHLFGAGGPSKDELTLQYTPPEVLFNLSTSSSRRRSSLNDSSHAEVEELYGEAYDAWSIGVIFLEIILGTADVFSVDQRTSAMIAHRLRGYSAEMIDQAMLLASFAEYCIYDGHSIHATSSSSSMKTARGDNATSSSSASVEKAIVEDSRDRRGDLSGQYNHYREFLSKISSPKYHSSIHLPRKSMNQGSEEGDGKGEGEGEPKEKTTTKNCGLPELSKAIQRRDPLGTGFTHGGGEDGNYAIDLIARLLRWDPSQRLSLDRALQHAYFVGPYISKHDNTSHPTLDELYKHDARYLKDQPLQHKSLPFPYRTRHATDSTDVDDSSSAAALTTHSLSLLTAPISRLMSRSNNNNNGEDNEDNDRYRYPSEGPSRHHTADESWHSTSSEQHDLPKEDDATILDGDKPHVVHADDDDDDDNDNDEEEKAVLMHVGGITVEVGDDDDDTNRLAFTCPKCGRKFVGDWNSCDKHVKSRKHGRRCSYSHDRTTDDDRGEGSTTAAALPDCISHHSMLPIDEQSGWCDLKGRRKHMEDAHAIVFADDNRYKFFGIFDGHWGSRAAKFSSRHIQTLFDIALTRSILNQTHHSDGGGGECSMSSSAHRAVVDNNLNDISTPLLDQSMSLQGVSPQWTAAYAYKGSNGGVKEEEFVIVSIDDEEEGAAVGRSAGVAVDGLHNTTTRGHHNNNDSSSTILSIHISMQDVMMALQKAFIATNDDFISIHPQSESSGSTATIAVLFSTHVVIAHVGDSRAMLCCDVDGRAFPLTSDHTPYLPTERSRIEDCGGWIEDYGVLRVNGQLAVTRSIGDRRFRRVLISNPDVLVFRRHHHHHHQISYTKINEDTDSDISSTKEESVSSSVVMSPCEAYHILYRRSHYDSTIVSTARYPPPQQFLVVASDGLWDVMTEQDVADFVCDHLGLYLSMPSSGNESFDNNSSSSSRRRNHVPSLLPIDAFHETAKLLAQEAYVRGSMDNIGVCLIDLY